jgi:hypothetical protein
LPALKAIWKHASTNSRYPPDAGISDSVAAARAMADKSGVRALLLVQSSAAGTFVQMPCVIVLEGGRDWDRDQVRSSLNRHRRQAVDDVATRRRLGNRNHRAAFHRTFERSRILDVRQPRALSLPD